MSDTKSLANIRIPPQNTDAEKALIGAIMIKPQSMVDVADIVNADCFYVDRHRTLFRTMLEMYSKGIPIDLLTLTSNLKEKGLTDSVGGASYIAELASNVPSASNAEYYAQIIRSKHVMRSMIYAAEKISQLGFSEGEDVEHLLDAAEKEIFSISNYTSQKFIHIKEELAEAWDRLDRLHKSSESMRGVPTGFPELDSKLAGLQKSDLIILAARPSVGKTSLALDIARNVAVKSNIPVGVFSLEMSAQQLVDRMLAAESFVDSWKLRTGRLSTDAEFSNIRDALDKLSSAPLYIDDDSTNTAMRMRSVARRLKSENGLGLIVVDYLQLMVPSRNIDNVVQQVTEISRSLKSLAREIDVPVLALSQLSRAVEARGGEPRLSDLRDSGSIEQDADVVMFIHRPDKGSEDAEKNNMAKVIIAKHRNGPTGSADLFFDEKRVSFTSVDKRDFGGF